MFVDKKDVLLAANQVQIVLDDAQAHAYAEDFCASLKGVEGLLEQDFSLFEPLFFLDDLND